MLSEKLIKFFKDKQWWFDDAFEDYKEPLLNVGIKEGSDFCEFYLHAEDCPTFLGRDKEIYQIGWFLLNSDDYIYSLERTYGALKMPHEYIPLDNFEGEYGYFYNLNTEEVLCLGLGEDWHNFMNGALKPQWQSFNSFLEWFFEL
jgi:hypothetical protein